MALEEWASLIATAVALALCFVALHVEQKEEERRIERIRLARLAGVLDERPLPSESRDVPSR